MLGTLTLENKCSSDLSLIKGTLDKWISLTKEEQKLLDIKDTSTKIGQLTEAREKLQNAIELETQFNVVRRDANVTRAVKDADGNIHMVPLVFSAKLPAKPITTIEINRCKFKTVTPSPTDEAMVALNAHGHNFDHCQLWWVPKDIMVEKLPDPDPILVGALKIEPLGWRFFELHRWIDEKVENGWWSYEGY